MEVSVSIDFRVEGQQRTYTVYLPAILTSSDGNLDTKDMKLISSKIENLIVHMVPIKK